VNPDLAIYQLRRVSVHFLKYREKLVLAQLSGCFEDHVKHFSVVRCEIRILGKRFHIVYLVQNKIQISFTIKFSFHGSPLMNENHLAWWFGLGLKITAGWVRFEYVNPWASWILPYFFSSSSSGPASRARVAQASTQSGTLPASQRSTQKLHFPILAPFSGPNWGAW